MACRRAEISDANGLGDPSTNGFVRVGILRLSKCRPLGRVLD